MNTISLLRKRVAENGETTISLDEFNQLQAEWITRAQIEVGEKVPVYDLQFKSPNPKMASYFTIGTFGSREMGYEDEPEFASLSKAESAALECSMEERTRERGVAIFIWDEFNEVAAVAIAGEIFNKRAKVDQIEQPLKSSEGETDKEIIGMILSNHISHLLNDKAGTGIATCQFDAAAEDILTFIENKQVSAIQQNRATEK